MEEYRNVSIVYGHLSHVGRVPWTPVISLLLGLMKTYRENVKKMNPRETWLLGKEFVVRKRRLLICLCCTSVFLTCKRQDLHHNCVTRIKSVCVEVVIFSPSYLIYLSNQHFQLYNNFEQGSDCSDSGCVLRVHWQWIRCFRLERVHLCSNSLNWTLGRGDEHNGAVSQDLRKSEIYTNWVYRSPVLFSNSDKLVTARNILYPPKRTQKQSTLSTSLRSSVLFHSKGKFWERGVAAPDHEKLLRCKSNSSSRAKRATHREAAHRGAAVSCSQSKPSEKQKKRNGAAQEKEPKRLGRGSRNCRVVSSLIVRGKMVCDCWIFIARVLRFLSRTHAFMQDAISHCSVERKKGRWPSFQRVLAGM